jgi:protein arginine kinase activator
MKCDLCEKPAVVHEVTVRNGIKKEVHLCESHARDAGITLPGTQPINQLLTQFVISNASKPAAKATSKACPGCDLTFAQFRQTGKVGCFECYDAFAELGPLIERAQAGGTHHSGKTPRRAGATIDRQLMIQKLVRELDHAVAAEQYERAAQLRDHLNTLDVGTRATGSSSRRAPGVGGGAGTAAGGGTGAGGGAGTGGGGGGVSGGPAAKP